MSENEAKMTNVKIAYIGGGSRGWAWGLMSDLAQANDLCGEVRLYDIDAKAAYDNEIIGNLSGGGFVYKAYETAREALTGADFVIISILPGTFDEMESDVHAPEKYGIYQSVGDTTGPGGIMRALRTIPMFEQIAGYIKSYCPDAWVINYTNPMSVCVSTLYKVFPKIKAFGCCHEVFKTQTMLADSLNEIYGINGIERHEIYTNVIGINHFTWITNASYGGYNLMDSYGKIAKKYAESGYPHANSGQSKLDYFSCTDRVKFDLFLRFGAIAAAGDRHLAEFCPGNWYLKFPETAASWGFSLTPVSWRKEDLKNRLTKSADLISGKLKFEPNQTGEEGVNQIRAILGLGNIVTNVNLPNIGQVSNLPLGAIVETNALFAADTVSPISAGALPDGVLSLMSPAVHNQQIVVRAGLTRNADLALRAFYCDRLVDRLSPADAKALFNEMLENTKKYLGEYNI